MPLTCSLFRSVLYVKKSVLGSQYFYLGKILGFTSTTMDIKKQHAQQMNVCALMNCTIWVTNKGVVFDMTTLM